MTADLARIEARLQEIDTAIARLDERLQALEAASAAGPGAAPIHEPELRHATAAGAEALESFDTTSVLSLVGRTFIVFGGAFFLRALTDTGRLPRGGGIVVGLLYALTWLAAADRSASRGRRLGPLFHGVAGVAIGLPLLWEASTRFGFLGPAASAVAVSAFTALALGVAWRRRLQGLAGVATVGMIGTALALVGASGQYVPFVVALILLGIATLWLGYDRDWFWLRWPTAFVADLVVVGLTVRALHTSRLERPDVVIAVQLLLLAAYLGSFTSRTLVRGRLVIPFEVVQTMAAILVGLGGAVMVAHASGAGEAPLGAASVALGLGCYAAAFAFVERRQGLGANFYFYATLALVLSLTGFAVLLRGAALSATLAGLGVIATWLGHRLSRTALSFHGAVYVATAVGVSGLLAAAVVAFTGGTVAAWPTLGASAWASLVAVWLCMIVPRPARNDVPSSVTTLPRVAFAVLLVIGSGAVALLFLAPTLAGTPPDLGALATLRTAVIAVAVVLLALATRVDRVAELGTLLYPVLVIGGLKLMLEDFRYSKPATLFVALALFGAALVCAPRFARRHAPADQPPPETVERAGAPRDTARP